MSDHLRLDQLPAGAAQVGVLMDVARRLWERQAVIALWVGGSLASGTFDAYSDVDLRVAVAERSFAAWKQIDLAPIFPIGIVGRAPIPFGEASVLNHLVLENGQVFDLFVTSAARDNPEHSIIILGCRDDAFATRLAGFAGQRPADHAPAEPDAIRRVIVDFWINSHKHRKVLSRGLDLMVPGGIQYDHHCLMRMWYAQITGLDAGPAQPSIHGLTKMTRAVGESMGERALALMGAPLGSGDLIIEHIEQLRDEASQAGRELAQRMRFEYPDALERTVRQGWDDFLARSRTSQ